MATLFNTGTKHKTIRVSSDDVLNEMVRRGSITQKDADARRKLYIAQKASEDATRQRGKMYLDAVEVLNKFKNGFAQDTLVDILISKGYSQEEVTMSMMVLLDENAIVYSRSGLLQLPQYQER